MTDKADKEWLRSLKAGDEVVLHTGSSKDDYYVVREVSDISSAGFIKVGYDLFNPETGIARGSSCACIFPCTNENMLKVARQGVQSFWLYNCFSEKKQTINQGIFEHLCDTYAIAIFNNFNLAITFNNFDLGDEVEVALRFCKVGIGTHGFEIIKNEPALSNAELALIADHGSLAFGYQMENDNIVIFTR